MPAGPIPPGRDPDAYDRLRRRVLWAMPSGLYVLGSRHGEQRNLMTISWVSQMATAPKLVAAGVESGSRTAELVGAGGCFAVSLLHRADRQLVRRFVKPATEVEVAPQGTGTIAGAPVFAAVTGTPILVAAAGFVDCEVRHRLDLGSHVLFVGEVLDCGGEPFAQDAGRPDVLRMEDTKMNYGG